MSLLPKITILADIIERDIRDRETAAGSRSDTLADAAPPSTGNASPDDAASSDPAPETRK